MSVRPSLLCLLAACCWPSGNKDVTDAIKQCMADDDHTAHTAMRTLAAQAEDDETWALIVMKVARKFGGKQWRKKDGQRTDAATQLFLLMDLLPLSDSRRALNASEDLLSFSRDEANAAQLRNALVIWNAFAGKFDVRVGSRMLTDEVLGFLMDNAERCYTTDSEVCMHALLALESFSKTGSENARRISEIGYFERLEELYQYSTDHQLRLICEWGLAHGSAFRSATPGIDTGAQPRKRKREACTGLTSGDSDSEKENSPGREKKSKRMVIVDLAESPTTTTTTTLSDRVEDAEGCEAKSGEGRSSIYVEEEGRHVLRHQSSRLVVRRGSKSNSRRRWRESAENVDQYEEDTWNSFEMDLERADVAEDVRLVKLNLNDRTNFIKLSSDGYEVRNDSTAFGSIRATCYVSSVDRHGTPCRQGKWYYEVTLRTGGIMQVGWATKDTVFKPEEGSGIGDDYSSYAYDGCRRQAWHAAVALPCGRKEKRWKAGDVVGCLFDTKNRVISFTLNGKFSRELGTQTFVGVRSTLAFYPALSLGAFQQCRVNFGDEPFRYAPDDYRSVNEFASTYDVPLEEGRESDAAAIGGNMDIPDSTAMAGGLLSCASLDDERLCKICYAQEGDIKLHPCGHREICFACSIRLTVCPVCRSAIEDREHVQETPATTDDISEQAALRNL